MQNRILNIGYVTGLDYKDPLLDPHAEFQRFKTHPFIARLLDGGKMIRYGAKTIAAGGYFAMPQIYADGVLLVGDCAGFLNSQRLKGIHSAIKSGMLAAEAIFEALFAGDFSAKQLQRYEQLVNDSWIIPELRKVRNFHAGFKHGRWLGLINTGLAVCYRRAGWGIFDRDKGIAWSRRDEETSAYGYRGDNLEQRYDGLRFDGKFTFNKLTDVYHAAVGHDEDQPAHLHVWTPISARHVARRSMAIPASVSVRQLFTRWLTMAETAGDTCRSTFQTAFTARRATSWIRTRSSTG